MVRQELQTAVRLCPRLAPLVSDAVLSNPASAAPEDAARIAIAAAELLPEPERNNDQTAVWGWRRHGVRIVTMMAIALEDPEVRRPCAYFGKLVTQERGAADLRLNLARILRQKGDIPAIDASAASSAKPERPKPGPLADTAPDGPAPLMFAPGVEDPPWPEINGELRRLVREGAHGSWFGRVGFHGIIDGVMTLSTPTSIAADRIKRDYVGAIHMAAETCGVWIERVVITVRKR
jgi:hypothetical protein